MKHRANSVRTLRVRSGRCLKFVVYIITSPVVTKIRPKFVPCFSEKNIIFKVEKLLLFLTIDGKKQVLERFNNIVKTTKDYFRISRFFLIGMDLHLPFAPVTFF